MCSATPTTVLTVGWWAPTRVWAAGRPLADAVPAGNSSPRTATRAARRRPVQRLPAALWGAPVAVVVVTGLSVSANAARTVQGRVCEDFLYDYQGPAAAGGRCAAVLAPATPAAERGAGPLLAGRPGSGPGFRPDHVPDRLAGKGVGNQVADHAEATGKPADNRRVLLGPALVSVVATGRLGSSLSRWWAARQRRRRGPDSTKNGCGAVTDGERGVDSRRGSNCVASAAGEHGQP